MLSISAICVNETPQPSRSMSRIRSVFPVRHLTAKTNMMCFGGLVLAPVTPAGELFNYVNWLRIFSLPVSTVYRNLMTVSGMMSLSCSTPDGRV